MAGSRHNTAVLLAGGVGSRLGGPVPKQLLKVAGRPVMAHTLAVLDAHEDVDDVVVMMNADHLDAAQNIVAEGGFTKVRAVLPAGDSRSATTIRALDALPDLHRDPSGDGDGVDPLVLTHDAVRPFVTPRIVADCFAALAHHDAVDVAIESRDTVVELRDDGTAARALARGTVRRGQTPQGFRASVLRDAYERAVADPDFEPADECTVVHRYRPDVAIAVVPGDERNIKITEPVDVFIADKLFALASRQDHPPALDDDGRRRVLDGRTVAVFGAGGGVGAALADLAERHGARVGRFGRSTGVHVERPDDVRRAVEDLCAGSGGLDLAVNAASVAPRGPLASASEESVYAATDLGYLAAVHVARACLPPLRRRRGSLLLLTSPAYAGARHGTALQSMADVAVVNLAQALADEAAPDGVRVNALIRPAGDPASPSTTADLEAVAAACIDTWAWDRTGQVVDPRAHDTASR